MEALENALAEYLVSRGCEKKKALEESKALLNFIRGTGHLIMTAEKLGEIKFHASNQT